MIKALVSKALPIFFLFLFLGQSTTSACDWNAWFIYNHQDFSKTLKKEFPISSNGTVFLKNKYGKIEVNTWEKDRVKIEVNIIVKTSDEDQAQEVFDRIQIDFSNDNDYVKAITTIESAKKNWWGWGDNKTEFKINYQVYMPQSANIDLSNKYGNATVAALNGKANISVKYGDFDVAHISKTLNVHLEYGAGTVVDANDIVADVAYSKFNIITSKECLFTTRYSKITVQEAENINTESRYDNYDIGNVAEFNCTARYGDVEIDMVEQITCNSQYTEYYVKQVSETADFDLRYGGVTVEEIANGFQQIILNGKYADYRLSVHEDAKYQLDANAAFAGIKYPSDLKITYEKEKSSSHAVKGHHGNGASVIKANLNYGGLRVRHN